MEKMYFIPESLVSGLMTYLQTRPYKEVAQGVAALSNLKEAKRDEPTSKKGAHTS